MTYTICTHCLLDTSDRLITFDEHGVCNYCKEYTDKQKEYEQSVAGNYFSSAIERIKRSKKKQEYDCIIGVSGGLDSSYLLYLAKEHGLNPLAVHYDCGWNTEYAVSNIEQIISKFDTELYTYVVDWDEFRDVQLAYLRSGVVDLEIPTDHSFLGALYKTAAKFGVKYILTGHNFVTEGIMPRSWVYNKGDATNIRDIYKRHGSKRPLHSFPIIGLREKFNYYNIAGIENMHLLNYTEYKKADAQAILEQHAGWKQHPVKHGESIWTRFYQCYILPQRFGIDKRKAHLSTLICSRQMTRATAIEEMQKPVYDTALLESDKDFVQKKFGITDAQMEEFMQLPIARHEDYKSDMQLKKAYTAICSTLGLGKYLKSSYHY